MNFEEAILNLVGGVFDSPISADNVVLHIGGAEVPLSEIRGRLDEGRPLTEDEVAAPRRGSPDYRAIINVVSRLDEQGMVTASLHGLWSDYGWRGVLDLMAAWVIQMENSSAMVRRARNMFGVIDITAIVSIEGDPEHTLINATEYAAQSLAINPEARPHEELSKALAMGERTAELGRAWIPVLHAAFAAAHQEPHNTQAVFAALFKGPDRNDRMKLIQMGVILGTAALGVRHMSRVRSSPNASGLLSWDEVAGTTAPSSQRG